MPSTISKRSPHGTVRNFTASRPNEQRVTLVREPLAVPAEIGEDDLAVVPFRAGETLRWRLH